MRKGILIRMMGAVVLSALPLGAFWSCTRMEPEGTARTVRLTLAVTPGGPAALAGAVETKAALINSLPTTLYWGVTTGVKGSETVEVGVTASSPGAGGHIQTDLEQNTGSPKAYNCYVTNLSGALALGTGAVLTVPDNSIDAMAGSATTSTASADIALEHLFSALGTLTFNNPTGATVSSATWTLEAAPMNTMAGTAGIYDLSTGSWSSVTIPMAPTVVTSGSNYLVIPGDYKLTAVVTVHFTSSGNSKTVTVSGILNMPAGRVCNVTGTMGVLLLDYDDDWTPDDDLDL